MLLELRRRVHKRGERRLLRLRRRCLRRLLLLHQVGACWVHAHQRRRRGKVLRLRHLLLLLWHGRWHATRRRIRIVSTVKDVRQEGKREGTTNSNFMTCLDYFLPTAELVPGVDHFFPAYGFGSIFFLFFSYSSNSFVPSSAPVGKNAVPFKLVVSLDDDPGAELPGVLELAPDMNLLDTDDDDDVLLSPPVFGVHGTVPGVASGRMPVRANCSISAKLSSVVMPFLRW